MPSPYFATRITKIDSKMYSESMRDRCDLEEEPQPDSVLTIPNNSLMKLRDLFCPVFHKVLLDDESKFLSTYEIFYMPDFQGQFEVRARKLMAYSSLASEFAMDTCITIGLCENGKISARVASIRYMNSEFAKVDIKVHSENTFPKGMPMAKIAATVVAEAMQL